MGQKFEHLGTEERGAIFAIKEENKSTRQIPSLRRAGYQVIVPDLAGYDASQPATIEVPTDSPTTSPSLSNILVWGPRISSACHPAK